MDRRRVAVCPPHEFADRQRLFRALACVFPVTFVPRDLPVGDGHDAAITFTREGHSQAAIRNIPRLEFIVAEDAAARIRGSRGEIRFCDSSLVDSRLRTQSLTDRSPLSCAHLPDERAEVLAFRDRQPSWRAGVVGACRVDVVASPPFELQVHESLRERCRADAGSLLPVVQFLREITEYSAWRRPPLRATFLIDDPNLHWPTYGFVKFGALARHAAEHGYHIAFATIPIDAWFTHKRSAELFKRAPSTLSLAVHGNDHLHRELDLLLSDKAAMQALRASLSRIEKLERRAQVGVSRVMVPPHGVCPDRVFAPLVATGFEALCREFPWWRQRSEPSRAIGGWGMADTSHAGLPVLARHLLSNDDLFDDLVVGAFLDQPVIPFGHAGDLAEGYDRLAALTRRINTLGGVRWGALGQIARSNYMTRTEDDQRLTVRLFSRRAHLTIADPISEIVVELPPGYPRVGGECVACDDRTYRLSETSHGISSEAIPVRGPATTTIRLQRRATMEFATPPPRRPHVRAVIRRAATEARDRLQPFLRSGGLEPALGRLQAAVHASRTRRSASEQRSDQALRRDGMKGVGSR